MAQLTLYPEPASEKLELSGADLRLFRRPDLGVDPGDLTELLLAQTPWRQESITVYGKTHLQPRLLAWYGDPAAVYSYSGKTHQPQPWTYQLEALRRRMEVLADTSFNSVLLNYYRDGRDSMGLHADDEPELGPEPVIASLSLGEERALYFRHKRDKQVRGLDVSLPHGSVLLMSGATQRHWKHGIRKLRRECGPRLNLTFRLVSSVPVPGDA